MAVRTLREFDGKRILHEQLLEFAPDAACAALLRGAGLGAGGPPRLLHVPAPVGAPAPDASTLAAGAPWVTAAGARLVAKPDCCIKRRGKGGLLCLDATWTSASAWLAARAGSAVSVDGVEGVLDAFLVEPFVPHAPTDEYYVCITSGREGEEILFTHEGGVDVGDVDAKAKRLAVPIGGPVPTPSAIEAALLGAVPPARRALLAAFISSLYGMYAACHFAYLEINPLVLTDAPGGGQSLAALDMAAKLDEAAHFLAGTRWGPVAFPPPFGRAPAPEEAFIRELDGKTGASLKLTILNRRGRVWTMVAGGGASVVYADTISDLGFGHELANYGEYSGAPSEDQTYDYARTILKLMTAEVLPPAPASSTLQGKVLIIGGGIANFTDVAKTFTGIIHALRDAAPELRKHCVTVWVRRGGPNYQEGLRRMAELGESIGVPTHVYGPDAHITAIVPMALGLAPVDSSAVTTSMTLGGAVPEPAPTSLARKESAFGVSGSETPAPTSSAAAAAVPSAAKAVALTTSPAATAKPASGGLFNTSTRCFVYGMQTRAVQGMLDFDNLCGRTTPSVAAMIFPFSGNHYQKFYWGTSEIMLPVYSSTEEAARRHGDVTVLINFASFRSVFPSTMEALTVAPALRTVAIIAEGVPEQQARLLAVTAAARGVMLIGPATVGGIAAGCFRIGNTGGMLDNIISCRLYRPGSVAYVSKSGGMSNELNNIIGAHTDGVCEGVAVGGDRYPGSRFIDHLLRYEANPGVKLLVLLGEVGGTDEYDVAAAIRDGRLRKPLVAWCIGTCAKMFPFEVQFGHAGALAGSAAQTADAKNAALAAAGAIVPANFNDFVAKISGAYASLVAAGTIVPAPEPPKPTVPMDYAWAKSLGLVRKPAEFVSSISDDRGEELTYAGVPISRVFEEDLGVGGVLSLLWFRRRLPAYAARFIEMVLQVTADHGPAVSGAHNTIVTARAGKDLVSSLVAGLLTIGPRFGGALDEAAAQFKGAHDAGTPAKQFVRDMRAANKLIMGIGHRVKSLSNPDKRVVLIKEFATKHFASTSVLQFALAVEAETTSKKENLILNVDGAIAVCFVDLLRSCGCFSREEADEVLASGCLNGLFVLGRSVGFIGHFLDQTRLKQGLYRHPTDDIVYLPAEH